MEYFTNFDDVQQSTLDLDLSQYNNNSHHVDRLSLPTSDILQDTNPFSLIHNQINYSPSFPTANFLPGPLLNPYSSNYNWSGQGHVNHVTVDNDDDRFGDIIDSVGEQNYFSISATHNMTTESPEIIAPLEPGNSNIYRATLRCSIPECSQDREYPSESALRKHEDKHSKPYICAVPNCKHPRFGVKGDLDRHNREVHGSLTHYCPITSCKRHVRGFPRKYNLFEHQKRCHSICSPNLASLPILSQENKMSENMKGTQGSFLGGSSPEMLAGSGGRLREKLENLYKTRAEISADIEVLQRSLELLGEDFHQ